MSITIPVNGYCDTPDVAAQLLADETIDANSYPNTTQVEARITEHFHAINAMLRQAGYRVPVLLSTTQLIIGTQLELDGDHEVDVEELDLKDSGGQLTGEAQEGDLILIAGDSQPYAITESVLVGTDNLVTVSITPELRIAASDGDNVTYTPQSNALSVLKLLSTLRVGAWAQGVKPGDEALEHAKELGKQAKELWEQVEQKRLKLIGVDRVSAVAPLLLKI